MSKYRRIHQILLCLRSLPRIPDSINQKEIHSSRKSFNQITWFLKSTTESWIWEQFQPNNTKQLIFSKLTQSAQFGHQHGFLKILLLWQHNSVHPSCNCTIRTWIWEVSRICWFHPFTFNFKYNTASSLDIGNIPRIHNSIQDAKWRPEWKHEYLVAILS